MNVPCISVIIATRNRIETLRETLRHLEHQSVGDDNYEVIVVDDGSNPPVAVAEPIRLVRLEGEERSAARNAGARVAHGELLVFIDDDVTVGVDFLEQHLTGHREWPDALLVGAIRLPEVAAKTPFGRFRQRLEDSGIPQVRGLTSMQNFCTAQNMMMSRSRFLELGGFEPGIVSGEDQDLALRHSASGGRIAFVPEARGIHRDDAMDIRKYCRRAQWGSRMMIPFLRRYPDFQDNVVRREVNGSFDLMKSMLATPPALAAMFSLTEVVERVSPDGALLDRLYRGLLGVNIYRGYRDGDRQA
jgi:glycosyltransferase involved in cell wall biosynthesis